MMTTTAIHLKSKMKPNQTTPRLYIYTVFITQLLVVMHF